MQVVFDNIKSNIDNSNELIKNLKQLSKKLNISNKTYNYETLTIKYINILLSPKLLLLSNKKIIEKEVSLILKRLNYNNEISEIVINMLKYINYDDIYFKNYFSIDKDSKYYNYDTKYIYILIVKMYFDFKLSGLCDKIINFFDNYSHIFANSTVFNVYKYIKNCYMNIIFPNIKDYTHSDGIVGEFIHKIIDHNEKKLENKIGSLDPIIMFHTNKLSIIQKKTNCNLIFIEKCYCKNIIELISVTIKHLPKSNAFINMLLDFTSNLVYFFENKIIPSKLLFKQVCKFIFTINREFFKNNDRILIDINIFIKYGYNLIFEDICYMTENYIYINDIELYDINLNHEKYYKIINDTNFNPYNIHYPWTIERLQIYCLDKISPTHLKTICDENSLVPNIKCLENLCKNNYLPIIKYITSTYHIVPNIECLYRLASRNDCSLITLKYLIFMIYESNKKNIIDMDKLTFDNFYDDNFYDI
jgi:hypothetical protein